VPADVPITVRRANALDADAVCRCLREAFEPYRERYTPAAFADTVLAPESVHTRLRDMAVFVAVDEGGDIVGTIGCTMIDRAEGHLRGMAVLPDEQGRGVAQCLLEAAEDELRRQGCQRITLDTTEPLARAMRFYERNGFRRSGAVRDFFGMPLIEYVKLASRE
jgi:GNAT superfamily N-acetyltransferase